MTQSETRKQDAAEAARRNRAVAIALAGDFSKAPFARAGFDDPALVLRWTDIVGPEIARLAEPVKLSDSAAGGVLTLKVESAASTFLQHETRRLCERINAYLGGPVVARLRFVEGAIAVRGSAARPGPVRAPVDVHDPARGFNGPEALKSAILGLARARKQPRPD